MLEEKMKESKTVISKLKKQMFQKDIQIRQDVDKEHINKNKDLIFRIEELQNENETLQKEIGRRDNVIKEKQKEIDLVYENMAHISSKIENKKIDNSVKMLERQNTDLLDLASTEHSQLKNKIKKRELKIRELEKERDDWISTISQLQRELSNANLSSPNESKYTGKENVAEIKAFLQEITILERKLDKSKTELEKYAVRLHSMESKYYQCAISSNL
jgi:phage host-nuclease inhibitor protein Gam